MTDLRSTSSIKIGDARYRKVLGDIDGLATSIHDIGLLHPIVITPQNELIAGGRRLAAYKRLGRKEILVRIIDLDSILDGEAAENAIRKDLEPSEAVALGEALEKRERQRAKKRLKEAGKLGGEGSGKLPEASKGQTRDKVGNAVGMSGRTYEKAKAVVKAANDDPAKFGSLLADMDRTGRVNAPFKRLKVIAQAEAIRAETPPLPNKGPYRVLVADPPWPYEVRAEDPSHRGVHPYPSMSIDEICAVDVASISHADSILWLWTTNHHMRQAFEVLDAWGFEQKTILTWAKDKMGLGDYLRGKTEHCLLAVRGKPIVQLGSQTTLLAGPRRKHSQKPDEFYQLVESLCPAPRYAYLFARGGQRPNWDGHGDEITSTLSADPAPAKLQTGAA